MTEISRPATPAELLDVISQANNEGRPCEVLGRGSKRGLGPPAKAATVIDMSACSGIMALSSEERTITAKAGTLLEEIEIELLRRSLRLGFEAADWGPLLGADPGIATIGGIIAAGACGPRSVVAGGIGRHLRGVRAVSGAGEEFSANRGQDGPDFSGLMAGSMGSLAVMHDVLLALAAHPQSQRTLAIVGQAPDRAIETMGAMLAGPIGIDAAAHLPAVLAACSAVPPVFQADEAVTALRLEGDDEWVAEHAAALRCVLSAQGPVIEIGGHFSVQFWREVREVMPFVGDDRLVWRLDLPAAMMAAVIASIAEQATIEFFYDRGGALAWVAFDSPAADAWAGLVEGAVGQAGRATLFRAPPELRRPVAFSRGTGGLSGRLRAAFDPAKILNPGRI